MMRKNISLGFGASVIAAAISLGSAPASAQETPQSADASADSLGEIIVTAQRRSENIQKVPISVVAASGADLVRRQIIEPSQLQFLSPSLQFTSYSQSPGANNFSVRGVGNLNFLHSIEPSVLSVVDDVPMARAQMALMDFMDVDRVEVLNGPQGTLFGRNASAGLINVVSKRPVLGEVQAEARLEYASLNNPNNADTWLAQGVLNLPLGRTAALRLNYSYSDQDSLVVPAPNAPGADSRKREHSFKGKFLWEPGDKLKVYIAGDYVRERGLGGGATAVRVLTPGSPEADPGTPVGPRNTLQTLSNAFDAGYKIYGGQMNVDYEVSDATSISNIVAWRKYTAFLEGADTPAVAYLYNPTQFNFRQLSEELRLVSRIGSDFSFQAGLYYLLGHFDRDTLALGTLNQPVPPPFTTLLGSRDISNERVESFAGYGQGTYTLGKFSLTAGGRLTHDRTRFSGSDTTLPYATGPLVPDRVVALRSSRTKLSWRFNAQYQLTPDVMLYGTVARGYKGDGYNLTLSGGAPVAPETSTMYEAGLKSRLFDRRMTFNLIGFIEDFSGFQSQAVDPNANPAFALTRVLNAASLKAKGFEAQVGLAVSDGLSLQANAAYVHARYGNFPNSPCYPGQTAAQGCVNGTYDITGFSLPNAPDWTFDLSADYHRPLTDRLNLRTRANYYWHSRTFFAQQNQAVTRQSGYGIMNASIGVERADSRWGVSLFCRNCFDKRFVASIATSNPATDYVQNLTTTSFRSIGVSVEAKF
jgi:iron complex outermembrane receptor protein